jgi:hypothetical protein
VNVWRVQAPDNADARNCAAAAAAAVESQPRRLVVVTTTRTKCSWQLLYHL